MNDNKNYKKIENKESTISTLVVGHLIFFSEVFGNETLTSTFLKKPVVLLFSPIASERRFKYFSDWFIWFWQDNNYFFKYFGYLRLLYDLCFIVIFWFLNFLVRLLVINFNSFW
jgi:hypothetical protein